MKNKTTKRIVFKLLSIVLIIILALPTAIIAWFVNSNVLSLNASGASVLSYFASGTGTLENPYIIENSSHLYHLSWLQNLGKLQKEKVYFRVDNDINMEGIVMPPIGIDKYPFIGSFDGNGKTISNLIVSNNKQELQIRFNVEDLNLGSSIGFFGNIDSITVPYSLATAGEAYSFYLENVNISSNEDNSIVGIVAGYNNGSLYNVGVSNNSFKMAEGKTVESEYTLVGKVGKNVEWYFSPNIPDPGTVSSKILVDPTGAKPFTSLEHARTTPTPIVADYLAVPDSMEYHAYYTSRLSVATAGFDKGVYIVDNYSEGTNDNGVPTITPISKGTTVTDINAKDELNDFWVTYKANSQTGKLNYIIPYTAPSFAATVNVPYNNIEGYLDIPYNGIWFKPRSSGSSSMAFSMTNQSSPSMMSVYEFERDENNNIIQSSWKETMFVFSETVYKHSEIAWFNFEVEQGKEYVVGKSTENGNTAGFLYLSLAGAGSQGYDEAVSYMWRVDYVMRDENDKFPDLAYEEYNATKTHLSFSGKALSTNYINFDKAIGVETALVHYTNYVDGIIIIDRILDGESIDITPPDEE